MWIFFTISSAFCFAIVNIVDKYTITKWVRQPITPVIISGASSLMGILLVYLFHGFSILSYFHIFLALIPGIFYALFLILYFKALKIEEVSRVVPLLYLSPLFVSFLAALFLNEIFTPLKYSGIAFLMTGSILILSKGFFKVNLGKAFWLILLAVFFNAIAGILTKYLLGFADFWTIFAYRNIGAVILLVPLSIVYFQELTYTAKKSGKKVIAVIFANNTLALFALFLSTIAVSIGFVSLVNALSSIQPFFVLVFTILLGAFYPNILKEEINKKVIFQKITAIALMFIGVILIT
ncbi:MAG: DMT family transporter [Candidatus Wildermuthbacteria bacterium]|nr:DMT family transporter [Candidatus Wildermuthbacteria bacterium]